MHVVFTTLLIHAGQFYLVNGWDPGVLLYKVDEDKGTNNAPCQEDEPEDHEEDDVTGQETGS